MDNMLEHPGTELQVLIKEKGLTQKAFSSILGKKVSEVNELLKGKRNITIQRDYLLHQTLGTPIKYWILKQIDYDYSLLDIEDQKSSPSVRGEAPKELGEFSDQASHSEQSEKSSEHNDRHPESEEHANPSNATHMDLSLQSKGQIDKQETPDQETKNEDDEDFKKRAKIFKSF